VSDDDDDELVQGGSMEEGVGSPNKTESSTPVSSPSTPMSPPSTPTSQMQPPYSPPPVTVSTCSPLSTKRRLARCEDIGNLTIKTSGVADITVSPPTPGELKQCSLLADVYQLWLLLDVILSA